MGFTFAGPSIPVAESRGCASPAKCRGGEFIAGDWAVGRREGRGRGSRNGQLSEADGAGSFLSDLKFKHKLHLSTFGSARIYGLGYTVYTHLKCPPSCCYS